jgi:hypothetical protein
VEARGILVVGNKLGEILEAGACPVFTQREEQDASHHQVASTRKRGAHVTEGVARRLVLEFME